MRPIRSAIVTVVVFALLLGITACGGSSRSVKAFCHTYQTEAVRLHDKYVSRSSQMSSSEPLTGLLIAVGTLAEAQGDLVTLFARLDKVAPDSIEPDVATIHDALKKQADDAGKAISDPLGALGGSIMTALTTQGSFTQVDNYLQNNCDLSFMKKSS